MKFDNSPLYFVETSLSGDRQSLFDLAVWKNGLPFRKIDFSATGKPIIKIAELNNGLSSSTSFTEKEYSNDVYLTRGDFVFSWSGNPETSIDIFRYNLPDGWLNQHIFKVTPNESIVDREYFYYVMKYLKPQFKTIATNKQTTGLGHITVADLKRMSVVVPSISVQEKISSILKAIDEKILLNKEINNNLEQQAQALYKAWFVDFQPYGGTMPVGWSATSLRELTRISTEVFSPQKNPNVEVEHYSIPAYDEKHFPVFETSDGIKSNKYRLTSQSVIISKLNPETKRIWRPYCLSDNPICSTEFIVYEPKNAAYRDFIYSVIDSNGFSAFLCSHTTGSTNSRQRATPNVTLNYDVILPDNDTLEQFCSIVSPMYEDMKNNLIENQKLITVRDTLLPKLMSGELDVSHIDL